MTPRRLAALWLGVIGEMFIITAEVIDPAEDDCLAIEQVVTELRGLVDR